jgi:superfamily I DNA/RNA helicase
VAETVERLLSNVAGTVGVIVPDARRALVLTALGQSDARVTVLTPLEVKGLEHDGVVVVDPDSIVAESAGGVRVLYVALTRATQRMSVIDVDTPGRWRPSGG